MVSTAPRLLQALCVFGLTLEDALNMPEAAGSERGGRGGALVWRRLDSGSSLCSRLHYHYHYTATVAAIKYYYSTPSIIVSAAVVVVIGALRQT